MYKKLPLVCDKKLVHLKCCVFVEPKGPEGKARGPEECGKGSRGPRAPIPPCSRVLAFPVVLPWAP